MRVALLALLAPAIDAKGGGTQWAIPAGMPYIPDKKGRDEWLKAYDSLVEDCRRHCPGRFCDLDTCEDMLMDAFKTTEEERSTYFTEDGKAGRELLKKFFNKSMQWGVHVRKG